VTNEESLLRHAAEVGDELGLMVANALLEASKDGRSAQEVLDDISKGLAAMFCKALIRKSTQRFAEGLQ